MQKKYDKNNIFYKIIKGDIPCNKVYEDRNILSFHDINPKAPVHVLVIPKEEYVDFDDFVENSDMGDVENFFKTVKKIADKLQLKSYRIVSNCGEEAGQIVFHFHIHIMGYK